MADPSLRVERRMHRQGASLVIGCDEVGRGAIAGPLAVGMVVVRPGVKRFPAGLRDSKMLAEAKREALAPLCREWAPAHAVGLVAAHEIDRMGLTACLGLAGARAFSALVQQGAPVDDAVLILDGNFDYLSRALGEAGSRVRVVARIKADRDCASVAAASVIAKTHRDALMREFHDELPEYGWSSNKGYASASHLDAIRGLGASRLHRHTWLHAVLDAPAVEDDAARLSQDGALVGAPDVGAHAIQTVIDLSHDG